MVLLGALIGVVGCGGGTERGALEAPAVPVSRGGLDRIGKPAPAWGEMEWIGSEPLGLEDLRGRVVLIRFWTDTCPFCRASAPALAELDADYRERGVIVIGMYHPKPRGTTRTLAELGAVRDEYGWRFPVAVDAEWAALDSFWLADGPRDYTSVSFVIDRSGIVRYVHPGPEYHSGGPGDHEACRRDYADVRAALDALLAEPRE